MYGPAPISLALNTARRRAFRALWALNTRVESTIKLRMPLRRPIHALSIKRHLHNEDAFSLNDA